MSRSKKGIDFLYVIFVYIFLFDFRSVLASKKIPDLGIECKVALSKLANDSGEIPVESLPVGVGFSGRYACLSCGTRDLPFKENTIDSILSCPNCGTPHSNEKPYLRERNGTAYITLDDLDLSEKDRKLLESGLRWPCSACGNSNLGLVEACTGCGSPRAEAKKVTFSAVNDLVVNRELTNISDPIHEMENEDLTARRRREFGTKQVKKEKPSRNKLYWFFGLLGAGGAGAGILSWGLQENDNKGVVTDAHWQHRLDIEEFQKVTYRKWRNEIQTESPVMPVNGKGERGGAFNLRCNKEVHHHIDVFDHWETYNVQIEHMKTVNKTRTVTVDQGNGHFKRVPEIYQVQEPYYTTETRRKEVTRKEPVLAEKCDYDTYEWKPIKTVSTQGGFSESSNNILKWPEPTLNELQRARQIESYSVSVSYEIKGQKKSHPMTIPSESEFKTWREGEIVNIKINNFGLVQGVQRLESISEK